MSAFIPTASHGRPSDGFIVVAVLWILAALATLASVYAIYVANTVTAARVHDDRVQAQALVSGAVELTAYQLTAADQAMRPTRGAFNFRMGGANVAVDFRSEAARIDLNAASKPLLAGLFTALGVRLADAEYFADRVIGWRTNSTGEDQAAGREASAYGTAGLTYSPRGARFAHVGELWLVLGIPPQLVARALPYVTVFSGRPNINVLDAAPLVLAALPGMSAELLNTLLNERGGAGRENGQQVLGLLGPAQASATLEGSKAIRVRIRVDLQNARVVNAVVVILIPESADEPFRVLSWRDDADGSIADELPIAGMR